MCHWFGSGGRRGDRGPAFQRFGFPLPEWKTGHDSGRQHAYTVMLLRVVILSALFARRTDALGRGH